MAAGDIFARDINFDMDDDASSSFPGGPQLDADGNPLPATVVLLWDMLKAKFRRAEEQEIARIIGRGLIQKCEDLREEYKSMHEIYRDVVEQSEQEELKKMQEHMMRSQSIFSLKGNQKFLQQELSFFIDNLQKKAVESGLEEDCLIPKKEAKDRQIYEYIKSHVIGDSSRPQSAITGHSSTVSKMSNSFVRDCDPMAEMMGSRKGSRNDPSGLDQTMRSSFYSTRNGGYAEEKGGIIESLQTKSVLDLSAQDLAKIEQIRDFMKEQAEGLQSEIEDIKGILLNKTAAKPEEDDAVSCAPSEKELKDYSSKLQAELLNSDQTISIQKAMNLPKDHIRFKKLDADPTAKLQTPGALTKKKITLVGTDSSKPPLKLTTKGPIKIIPKDMGEARGSAAGLPLKIGERRPSSAIKMPTLKRQDSNANVKDGGTNPPSGAPKLKLKIRPPSASKKDVKPPSRGATPTNFRRTRPPQQKVQQKPANQEVYGLDIEFLEGLGLGDLIDDLDGLSDGDDKAKLQKQSSSSSNQIDSSTKPPRKRSIKQQQGSEPVSENMTFEEMREKFNSDAIPGSSKVSNRLRGVCAQYNE